MTWRGAPRVLFLVAVLLGQAAACAAAKAQSRLGAADLGVVINTADPLSRAIGEYYVAVRHISPRNVARVRFDYQRDDVPGSRFAAIRAAVEQQVGRRVQAYALTWARPYRVGCMSITSAFAFGVDARYCAQGCAPTRLNPYYDASTSRPFYDLRVHPTMAIAAVNFQNAKALIDRGVAADGAAPRGTAYFVATDDVARNARAVEYVPAAASAKDKIGLQIIHSAGLGERPDILFYFIGAQSVPGLESNRFLPGAIADHLTSFGGMLTDSSQMSSLRWIEAGATGSYGTVVEPCNLLGKFPDIRVVMKRYLAGETLIEAYWKSVAMPGQGIFIGEPLAAPFGAPLAP